VPESAPVSDKFLPVTWLELPDGRHFWLNSRCAIGRLDDNDLVLQTPALSRRHALLAAGPGGYTLTDLQSSNGTYLNHELVKRPMALNDGDEIQIGEVVLRYRDNRQMKIGTEAVPTPLATQVLHNVRPRHCWLLVTDIVGYSTLNEQIGSEAALSRLQQWITGVRPLLVNNGASINSYVGDAIFAYWPSDVAPAAQVLAALENLEAYRPLSPLPFRTVVHHGCALFTKSEKGEELTGQDVNFVFRAEKVAKHFRTLALLSQTAVQTLKVDGRCAALGESAVDGMSGAFTFYGLPRFGPA